MQLISGGTNALVTVGPVTTVDGRLKTSPFDRAAQEDARRFIWSGEGETSLEITSVTPIDLSRESNGALAIELDVRVDALSDAPIYIGQSCGAGCAARIDIGPALRPLAGRGWQTVSIPLSCLAGKGVDMTRVTKPLQLITAGKTDLSLSRIALGTSALGVVRCT